MHNSLDKGLDTELEIPGGEQNIPPDVFMNAGVLLKKILNGFSIYSALLKPSIVDVGDIVIPHECGKVLWVPDDLTFYNIADIYISLPLYLLSPHDRVKKIWNGPTFSSIAFSSILLTLQYLDEYNFEYNYANKK